MSRRSHSGLIAPDKDTVMGPPPIPAPLPPAQQPSAHSSKPKDSQEIAEKYRKLKRKYFDLEEKHKETSSELQRSGERNVKMREERDLLLDRIIELESQPTNRPNGASGVSQQLPTPSSGAFPRSLISTRARNSFVANLRQAVLEDDADDVDADPLLTSHHVGPLARKRAEEEKKERLEEEAREARRAARRGKGTQGQSSGQKGKEASVPTQPPLSFVLPQHIGPSDPEPAPVLISSTGTRLRIKPPAPPTSAPDSSQNAAASAPSSSRQSHPQPPLTGPPPSQQQSRSESPLSPMPSTQDEPSPRSTSGSGAMYSPTTYFRNGNGGNGPPGEGATVPNLLGSPNMPPLPSHPLPHSHTATSNSSSSRNPSEVQRHAKPKRLKAHTVTSKNFSIPMVPRDKKNKPMLPLNVGIMTVINLGEVCMREHFHTERYIFPVGYEVTRRYLSTIDPNAEVVYHCTILDGGDGPKFQIVPSDVPERPVIAGTATGAWSNIVKQANQIRNRQHSNSVSGPDFFGLGQNTIKHLIQELPGADRLRDYVWQKFVEGGPLGGRHAAVIPALPEEYDASMPLGAYYPPDRERKETEEKMAMSPNNPQSSHHQQQLQQQQQQALHPGLTQIVLPPPTSETLNIQEYQPPAAVQKEVVERRVTRMSARAASPSRSHRKMSPSSAAAGGGVGVDSYHPLPPPPSHTHHTRSSSQASRRELSGSQSSSYRATTTSVPAPAPALSASPPSSSSSPPPPPPPAVPATFASIMNAYPAPSASASESPRPTTAGGESAVSGGNGGGAASGEGAAE